MCTPSLRVSFPRNNILISAQHQPILLLTVCCVKVPPCFVNFRTEGGPVGTDKRFRLALIAPCVVWCGLHNVCAARLLPFFSLLPHEATASATPYIFRRKICVKSFRVFFLATCLTPWWWTCTRVGFVCVCVVCVSCVITKGLRIV